jgi:hypothetical protein
MVVATLNMKLGESGVEERAIRKEEIFAKRSSTPFKPSMPSM